MLLGPELNSELNRWYNTTRHRLLEEKKPKFKVFLLVLVACLPILLRASLVGWSNLPRITGCLSLLMHSTCSGFGNFFFVLWLHILIISHYTSPVAFLAYTMNVDSFSSNSWIIFLELQGIKSCCI